MKRTLIIVALAAVAFLALRAPAVDFSKDTDGGIQFHRGTFIEALQQAKTENKLIFLDIYATWCGPCKRLKAKTFADKEAGKFFNTSFVNVALDGEGDEGSEIAAKYGVSSYPTLLFIDGDGTVVMEASGYRGAGSLIELGNNAINKTKK